MRKQELTIKGIPAILWGKKSERLFLAVHGSMSDKQDTVISRFAGVAEAKGYQTLSFDLPGHGDRKNVKADLINSVADLITVMEFARTISIRINIFACSVGAYYTLMAFADESFGQCLFLSPVVDMEKIITDMIKSAGIDEERLKKEKEFPLADGRVLSWQYLSLVRAHPIVKWKSKTSILYGADDSLCPPETINDFCGKFFADITVMKKSKHYFRSPAQLRFFTRWLKKTIIKKRGSSI